MFIVSLQLSSTWCAESRTASCEALDTFNTTDASHSHLARVFDTTLKKEVDSCKLPRVAVPLKVNGRHVPPIQFGIDFPISPKSKKNRWGRDRKFLAKVSSLLALCHAFAASINLLLGIAHKTRGPFKDMAH